MTVDELKRDHPKVYESNSDKLHAVAKRGGGTIRIKHAGVWLDVIVRALEE